MRLFIGITIFILFVFSSYSQIQQYTSKSTVPDTIIANEYFSKAEKLYEQAQYDSSIAYFEKSCIIYQKEKLVEKYVQCYNHIGKNYTLKGEYQKALSYLNKAIEIGIKLSGEKKVVIAESYNQLGIINYYQSNYDKSLELYNKSLLIKCNILGKTHPDIAKSYNNIGLIYQAKGNYDQALEFINRALSIKSETLGDKHTDIAQSYNNLGYLYEQKGNYNQALKFHQKSLSIRLEILGNKHPKVAGTYANIGNVYYHMGDYDEAYIFYSKSLSIWLETLGNKHPNVAKCYSNIGIIHQQKGRYDSALEFYNKALSIMVETLGNKHLDLALSYFSIGLTYDQKGDYDRALEFFYKALSLYIEKFGEKHPYVANYYNNIGNIYNKKGNYHHALDFYNKALSIFIETLGYKHPYIAKSYHGLVKIYQQQNDFVKALSYCQKSITVLIPDFNDLDIYHNPPLKKILSEPNLLISLALKGDALYELYSKQSHNIKDLKMSVSTYELASDLIDKIRSGYKAEGSKLILAEIADDIFDKAIYTAYKLYQITGENQYKEKAFTFAEKNKVGVLRQALTESDAKKFANIPEHLLKKEKQLKIDLSFYYRKLANEQQKKKEPDNEKIQLWQDKLFTLNREYDDLIIQIEEKYPAYYNLKYKFNTIFPGEIQRKLLTKNSALIEYSISDSSLFIFTITKDNFDLTFIPIDSTFYSKVNQFYGSIRKLDLDNFLTSSSYLHNILIHPVREKIASLEKIIIIPDGILYYMPFEALVKEEKDRVSTIDFTRLNYLIKDYAISYHYSSTLLSGKIDKQSKRKETNFVGFAPVFSEKEDYGYILSSNVGILDTSNLSYTTLRSVTVDGKRFAELPISQKEVSSIVKLFVKNKEKAVGYFHNEATEENFKSEVTKDYQYIHIATHGLINEKNPKLSGLIFAQTRDSSDQKDGILYSGETYNLTLNTDLVILSSCESGIGPLVKGEGIMALTRGFLYSGARNIIFSLWKVDDKPTAELMIEFYKNILVHKDFAYALRKAKLCMINNKYSAFPKNWSSFVLIGG